MLYQALAIICNLDIFTLPYVVLCNSYLLCVDFQAKTELVGAPKKLLSVEY